MANKIIKFVSNQTGPFTVSNNKVDITLPAYVGYADMMRTCIVLNMKLLRDDLTDLGLFDAGFNEGLDATCLIKTCSISTDKSGVLEQIPQPNILLSNLEQTQRDFEDEHALGTYGFGTVENQPTSAPATERLATFIRKVKDNEGNTSRTSTTETYLKIPLSKLFGVCKMNQFPVNLFGNIKISLEFEDDTKNIVPCLFKQVLSKTVDVGVSTGVGTQHNIFLPEHGANDFYVGQPVSIVGSGGGAADRNIVEISHNTNNKTSIRFDGNAIQFDGNGGGQNTIAPRASGVNDVDLTYSIQDVELEVYQWILSPKQQASLNSRMKRGVNMDFTTYSLERINMPSIATGQQYTKQFDLEPNTINVFALMPKFYDNKAGDNQSQNSQQLFSVADGLNSYRWRLNMVDTTTRDVVPYQSLYNDRLMVTLSNARMKIKNLRLAEGKRLDTDDTIKSDNNQPGVKSFIIPSPIPQRNEQQVIQLRINQDRDASANGGGRILHLYKQVEKSLNLKASGVEVV